LSKIRDALLYGYAEEAATDPSDAKQTLKQALKYAENLAEDISWAENPEHIKELDKETQAWATSVYGPGWEKTVFKPEVVKEYKKRKDKLSEALPQWKRAFDTLVDEGGIVDPEVELDEIQAGAIKGGKSWRYRPEQALARVIKGLSSEDRIRLLNEYDSADDPKFQIPAYKKAYLEELNRERWNPGETERPGFVGKAFDFLGVGGQLAAAIPEAISSYGRKLTQDVPLDVPPNMRVSRPRQELGELIGGVEPAKAKRQAVMEKLGLAEKAFDVESEKAFDPNQSFGQAWQSGRRAFTKASDYLGQLLGAVPERATGKLADIASTKTPESVGQVRYEGIPLKEFGKRLLKDPAAHALNLQGEVSSRIATDVMGLNPDDTGNSESRQGKYIKAANEVETKYRKAAVAQARKELGPSATRETLKARAQELKDAFMGSDLQVSSDPATSMLIKEGLLDPTNVFPGAHPLALGGKALVGAGKAGRAAIAAAAIPTLGKASLGKKVAQGVEAALQLGEEGFTYAPHAAAVERMGAPEAATELRIAPHRAAHQAREWTQKHEELVTEVERLSNALGPRENRLAMSIVHGETTLPKGLVPKVDALVEASEKARKSKEWLRANFPETAKRYGKSGEIEASEDLAQYGLPHRKREVPEPSNEAKFLAESTRAGEGPIFEQKVKPSKGNLQRRVKDWRQLEPNVGTQWREDFNNVKPTLPLNIETAHLGQALESGGLVGHLEKAAPEAAARREAKIGKGIGKSEAKAQRWEAKKVELSGRVEELQGLHQTLVAWRTTGSLPDAAVFTEAARRSTSKIEELRASLATSSNPELVKRQIKQLTKEVGEYSTLAKMATQAQGRLASVQKAHPGVLSSNKYIAGRAEQLLKNRINIANKKLRLHSGMLEELTTKKLPMDRERLTLASLESKRQAQLQKEVTAEILRLNKETGEAWTSLDVMEAAKPALKKGAERGTQGDQFRLMVGAPGQFQKGKHVTLVPQRVADHIARLTLLPGVGPTGAKQTLNSFMRRSGEVYSNLVRHVIRPGQSIWRTTAILNPATIARDYIGAIGLNTLNAGMRSFGSQAGKSMQLALMSGGLLDAPMKGMKFTDKSGKNSVDLVDFARQLMDNGILNQVGRQLDLPVEAGLGSKTARAYQNVVFNRLAGLPGTEKLSPAAMKALPDNYQKIMAGIEALKQDASPAGIRRAIDLAAQYGGHYDRMGAVEKHLLRDAFAFYSWPRFIVPRTMKAFIESPQVLANWDRVRQYLSNRYGREVPLMMEQMRGYQRGVGFPGPAELQYQGKDAEDVDQNVIGMMESSPLYFGALAFPPLTGLVDVNTDSNEELMKALGPFARAAYEITTGRDMNTNEKLGDVVPEWADVEALFSGNEPHDRLLRQVWSSTRRWSQGAKGVIDTLEKNGLNESAFDHKLRLSTEQWSQVGASGILKQGPFTFTTVPTYGNAAQQVKNAQEKSNVYNPKR
jgi:hypothetical protein